MFCRCQHVPLEERRFFVSAQNVTVWCVPYGNSNGAKPIRLLAAVRAIPVANVQLRLADIPAGTEVLIPGTNGSWNRVRVVSHEKEVPTEAVLSGNVAT